MIITFLYLFFTKSEGIPLFKLIYGLSLGLFSLLLFGLFFCLFTLFKNFYYQVLIFKNNGNTYNKFIFKLSFLSFITLLIYFFYCLFFKSFPGMIFFCFGLPSLLILDFYFAKGKLEHFGFFRLTSFFCLTNYFWLNFLIITLFSILLYDFLLIPELALLGLEEISITYEVEKGGANYMQKYIKENGRFTTKNYENLRLAGEKLTKQKNLIKRSLWPNGSEFTADTFASNNNVNDFVRKLIMPDTPHTPYIIKHLPTIEKVGKQLDEIKGEFNENTRDEEIAPLSRYLIANNFAKGNTRIWAKDGVPFSFALDNESNGIVVDTCLQESFRTDEIIINGNDPKEIIKKVLEQETPLGLANHKHKGLIVRGEERRGGFIEVGAARTAESRFLCIAENLGISPSRPNQAIGIKGIDYVYHDEKTDQACLVFCKEPDVSEKEALQVSEIEDPQKIRQALLQNKKIKIFNKKDIWKDVYNIHQGLEKNPGLTTLPKLCTIDLTKILAVYKGGFANENELADFLLENQPEQVKDYRQKGLKFWFFWADKNNKTHCIIK